MSEKEYEVLGELYFIQSLQQLHLATGILRAELLEILKILHRKEWINVSRNRDGDKIDHEVDWEYWVEAYFFVASRKGLFAHNSV